MVWLRSQLPRATSVEIVDLDRVEAPAVRLGLQYWRSLRGTRSFPAREDIRPRDIVGILPNMVLAKVLDEGRDFLLKIVGDEVGRAYRAPLNNRRMHEIAIELPNTIERWANLYRQVTQTAAPVAVRVVVGHETAEVNFAEAETVCLPLGPTDDCIDHLMTFSRRWARTALYPR